MADSGNNGKHDKTPPPASIAPYCFKPGVVSRPKKRRRPKRFQFIDHMTAYFDEEVDVPSPGMGKDGQRKTERMTRLQYFARMIGNSALNSQDPKLRIECIKIVCDMLSPGKSWKAGTKPFIEINQTIHRHAAGFFDDVEKLAAGDPVTPQLIIEALRVLPTPKHVESEIIES